MPVPVPSMTQASNQKTSAQSVINQQSTSGTKNNALDDINRCKLGTSGLHAPAKY